MSSLLDEERGVKEVLTAVQDLTGSDPPQSFPIMLPEGWDRPLDPCLLLHMARQLMFENKGAATKGTADLRRIGWLIHPIKEWLCPGKGS